jgi:capsular polysaccharide biosynthesis protein
VDEMNNLNSTKLPDILRGKESNLKEQFFIIKSKLWILVLITLLTTTLGVLKNEFFSTPIYESSTRVIISTDPEYMKTLIVLVKDTAVMEKVKKELGIKGTSEQLAQQINVGSIDGSQVVRISVMDTDPVMAAEIANATAKNYKSEMPNIVGFNKVKLLSAAKINDNPINSGSEFKTIIAAMIVGVVLGVGVIYFLHALDDTFTSNDEIEELLGLTILGTISKMNKKNTKKKHKGINGMGIRGESVGL